MTIRDQSGLNKTSALEFQQKCVTILKSCKLLSFPSPKMEMPLPLQTTERTKIKEYI